MQVLFAGDLTASGRIKGVLLRREFDRIMPEIVPIINDVDYSILNLESPIVRGGIGTPILKNGPHLSAPPELLEFIKSVGFNCVTLANNHILDYGGDALSDTLSLLQSEDVDHVGAGRDLDEASKVLIKQINGLRIAFVGACEAGFNLASEESPGACPLDVVRNARQIQYAKSNADYVAVLVHGGLEMYRLPTPRMVETYRYFIDIGADAVITHHQHCCSGYEIYQGRPIIYGLGNLCMDRESYPNRDWYYGYLAIVDFKRDISVKIIPYSQNLRDVGVRLLKGAERDSFMLEIEHISRTILDSAALKSSYGKYISKKQNQVFYRFSPYSGKFASVLAQKGLLSVEPSKKRAMRIFEYLANDSHRDIARGVFSSLLKK